MGHPISGALLIYQDATREPDHEIAASMGKEFAAAKKSKGTGKSTGTAGTSPKRSCTQRARGPKRGTEIARLPLAISSGIGVTALDSAGQAVCFRLRR